MDVHIQRERREREEDVYAYQKQRDRRPLLRILLAVLCHIMRDRLPHMHLACHPRIPSFIACFDVVHYPISDDQGKIYPLPLGVP